MRDMGVRGRFAYGTPVGVSDDAPMDLRLTPDPGYWIATFALAITLRQTAISRSR